MANYADHFNNLSGNYYDITTNYIKDNPDDKAHLWSILLSYLHSKNGLTENDLPWSGHNHRGFKGQTTVGLSAVFRETGD